MSRDIDYHGLNAIMDNPVTKKAIMKLLDDRIQEGYEDYEKAKPNYPSVAGRIKGFRDIKKTLEISPEIHENNEKAKAKEANK